MSEFTDQDIPICCGECFPAVYTEGLKAMTDHILIAHLNYSFEEAEVYARLWMEDAYAKTDVERAEYAGIRKQEGTYEEDHCDDPA